MEDRFEEYIKGHRQDFDMLEPDDRLWEGIEKKMDGPKKLKFKYYFSRAAAVAAIFVFSFVLQKYFFRVRNNITEIPELREAELYYTGLIQTKLNTVEPMLAKYPDIERDLKNDLSELDSVYNELKEDLNDNIANQEVLEALISNYMLRIDILEEMLHFLTKKDEKNNLNNSEYEF